ncbi:cell division protein FtsX [Fusobacterium mortiferum]|jgi:cell division transport system permease protein|uniref:cell division protein FtsX n=1 Tax=Fusobacterium mortiferum TaxID=850 RepID=UPI000E453650|nr:permease-like cell division protein FtsX [Fusobacterium mortiferum]RGM98552.1 cell division protein FtsX [Fusobacterium mortiferum]
MNNFNLMKMEKNTIRTKIQIKKTTFILTVLSFIILNFFLAFFINVDAIKSRVEAGYFFTADFHKNVSSEDKEKLEIEILKLEGVKQVRYVSKEEAFQKVQYQLDVAIPKGENPLSDSLIIFFDKPTDIEKIQVKLENNENIKEVFVDGEYINYKERQLKFYQMVSVGIVLGCILPLLALIYYIFYSAVSIDYINNVGLIKDDKTNRIRAKSVNLLPFTAGSIIGTLIFFNIYIYFRNHLLLISNRYLVLSLKEIIFIQFGIILIINLLIWLKPIKIGVFKWVEDGK